MKRLQHIFLFLGLLLWQLPGIGQILDVDPAFPNVEDTVTIIYDASQGNAALEGVSPVYAHAGLITTASTSPTDWKYVQGTWGTPDPKVVMEDLGNNKHRIKYHIRSFYGLPQGITATNLAFVFRNAAGNVVGRSADGSDIFYDLYAPGQLAAAILDPKGVQLVEAGDSVVIKAEASDSCNLSLLANGSPLFQTTGRTLNYTFFPTSGDYLLEFVADNGSAIVKDTLKVYTRPIITVMDPPSFTEPGITFLSDTSVRLALLAPEKQYVYVLGDFNEWEPRSSAFMNRTADGRLYWIDLNGLTPGQEYAYQYFIDGVLRVADPYATKVLDPWNDPWIPATTYPNLKAYPTGKASGIVSVLQPAAPDYQWATPANWDRPEPGELVIYELLVRDFSAARTFQVVLDSLDYLQRIGVNAIEFMPLMEFEGNESWGYNPMHYFAVDKYYGTSHDLKTLIDSCHARGIAVILDMVLNHAFGQCPLVQMYWDGTRPAANSPWFNQDATHPFNVGFDFNHESNDTKYFSDRVLKYWVEEYRFDGYRMDLSKGFTQVNNPNNVGAWGAYDASRIAILDRMENALRTISPEVYFILEHFGGNQEEEELSDKGMMVWGNLVHAYNESTMGYLPSSNFDWISYQKRGWDDPHVVGYMESHDEERLMYKNLQFGNASGSYSTKNLNTALARMEQAVAFFLTVPGPKMIWQFGELGYDYSIDFNGRVGNKPVKWDYLEDPNRYKLYKVYSAVGQLRQSSPAFTTTNYNMEVGGAIKRIWLSHSDMDVMVIGNFDVVNQSGTPSFQHTGWWYDYFSGDSMNVTNTSMTMSFAPGEFHIYTDRRLTQPDVTLSVFEQLERNPFSLEAMPNPAALQSELQFVLPASEVARMEVLDLQGRVLLREDLGRLPAGQHNWSWNLQSAQGQRVASGMYLVRLQAGAQAETLRLMVE